MTRLIDTPNTPSRDVAPSPGTLTSLLSCCCESHYAFNECFTR